jgi:hypothetical protein
MTGAPVLLYVALEDWFSSTRLPRRLTAAGFKVVAICTAASPLLHVGGIDQSIVIRPEGLPAALDAASDHHGATLIQPVDEAAVTAIRAVARAPNTPPALVALIERSVGAPACDGAGSKERVNEIAATIGVRAPRQAVVESAAGACALARTIGYPIVIKKEQTFGGMGVMRCADDRATMINWYRLQAQARWQRGVARVAGPPAYALAPLRRALMRRPASPLIAQQFVTGPIGFRTFVADRGRVLAGITGIAEAHNPAPFGASSVVRFVDHPEIERATAALVGALELSGFGGVDFIFEAGSQRPYLLEVNARVTPIAHLGQRLGIDLCAALHAALTGAAPPSQGPLREQAVALFPSELDRDPNSPWFASAAHDVPWDEPELLDAWSAKFSEPVRAFLARTPVP